MAKNEARFQKKVTSFGGVTVHSTAIDDQGGGNGVVFYETTVKWEQTDRTGTVVERWKNGKIQAIRFYGNYEPGDLPK